MKKFGADANTHNTAADTVITSRNQLHEIEKEFGPKV